MSKLQTEDENPVDKYLLMGCDYLMPYFKKLNFTPNGITTLSNICSAIGLYGFYNNNPITFYIFMWLGYFFDCFDGYYARTYNMTTVFGDYYDHISDIFFLSIFLYMTYSRYKYLATHSLGTYLIATTLVMLLLLMGKHIGCQEQIHEDEGDANHKSHSLTPLKWLCTNKEDIKWTKYFGIGTGFAVLYTGVLSLMLMYPPNI